jgi:hypothetical protein
MWSWVDVNIKDTNWAPFVEVWSKFLKYLY